MLQRFLFRLQTSSTPRSETQPGHICSGTRHRAPPPPTPLSLPAGSLTNLLSSKNTSRSPARIRRSSQNSPTKTRALANYIKAYLLSQSRQSHAAPRVKAEKDLNTRNLDPYVLSRGHTTTRYTLHEKMSPRHRHGGAHAKRQQRHDTDAPQHAERVGS